MRILLINPPFTIHRRYFRDTESFPLGLAYVAASCRSRGHEVGVFDAHIEGYQSQVREGDYVRRVTDGNLVAAGTPVNVNVDRDY